MGAPVASGTLAGSTSGSWTSIHKEVASSDFSSFGRHPSGRPTRTTLSTVAGSDRAVGCTEPTIPGSPGVTAAQWARLSQPWQSNGARAGGRGDREVAIAIAGADYLGLAKAVVSAIARGRP